MAGFDHWFRVGVSLDPVVSKVEAKRLLDRWLDRDGEVFDADPRLARWIVEPVVMPNHPAVAALRALAIVGRQRPGVARVELMPGGRCRVCRSEWSRDGHEEHKPGCPLEGSS